MFNEESRQKKKLKIEQKTNPDLQCPMNYLFGYKFERVKPNYEEIPMSEFFVKHPLDTSHRKSKQIESLIQKYSIELSQYFMDTDENNNTIHISNKYVGLMSWLIDRAFKITPQMQSNKENCNSNMWRNRPILLKVLYTINPEALLKCFSKGII